MFAEVANLRVALSADIGSHNIMKARRHEGEMPRSPWTGRAYDYRLIDLELAKKRAAPPSVITLEHDDWLRGRLIP